MKHTYRSILKAVICALASFAYSNAWAQIQPTISYQGVLQNNGAAVNGIDTLKILIYNSETGGTPLYTETQTANVVNGIFNISIGAVKPLLPTLDFTKQFYLSVSVNGGPELTPRAIVSFAPYSIHALNADTLSGDMVRSVDGQTGALSLSGTNGITVSNSGSKITLSSKGVQSIDSVSGALTLTGAGGTTVTYSGTSFYITSPPQGISTLRNTDGAISIANPNGTTTTIGLAGQNASSGQVLQWNGSSWHPATIGGGGSIVQEINNLLDGRSFSYNVFLGNLSGVNDIIGSGTGDFNTAVGISAMNENISGHDNLACGYFALGSNTSGYYNTATGSRALYYNTSGLENTALGGEVLGSNTTGNANTGVGYQVLISNTTGGENTAIGLNALFFNWTGGCNTAGGNWALYNNTSGQSNVALGYYALTLNSSGNNNTAIGDSAGTNTTNLNNTTSLGNGAQATASNEVIIGNANVTSLYCQGAYAATTAASANMVVASNGQIMRSTSSARYKTNIHDLDINTDRLYDLRPVSYISKIDGNPYFGLVAEDVAKVLPELAEYARAKDVIPGSNSDELIPDAVKYPMLSVLLLDELKKEHARASSEEKIIDDLARRVEALEASQKAAH